MKKLEVEFYFSGIYINTDHTEVKQFEFEDETTQEEINEVITEELTQWLYEKSNASFRILDK